MCIILFNKIKINNNNSNNNRNNFKKNYIKVKSPSQKIKASSLNKTQKITNLIFSNKSKITKMKTKILKA